VEKAGAIRVVEGGTTVRDQNFLDIGGLLTDGEQGLLGLAFHPDYATNGRFFVYVTPSGPRRNTVREYRRSEDDPYRADTTAVATLIDENDSESNHNGGMIAFGPDGYLYVGMGDEGGGGDRHGPTGNGLNTQTLFGSILRLDVDAGPSYAAAGNPFDGSDGRTQIWAYGIRNPWRFSFDRGTGDLWIGDVGQGSFEEITWMPSPIAPGANLGWRAYEGFSVFDEGLVSMVPDHFEPIIDYRQGRDDEPIQQGCSVTGGYVYRGSGIPALQGWYLYGDYCSPSVAAIRTCEGALQDHERIDDLSFGGSNLVSFGQNGHGDLFIVFLDGSLRRIVPG
jgi:glucose/arabinose dehydrogenase